MWGIIRKNLTQISNFYPHGLAVLSDFKQILSPNSKNYPQLAKFKRYMFHVKHWNGKKIWLKVSHETFFDIKMYIAHTNF